MDVHAALAYRLGILGTRVRRPTLMYVQRPPVLTGPQTVPGVCGVLVLQGNIVLEAPRRKKSSGGVSLKWIP